MKGAEDQFVTTDISTGTGSFDIVQIGTYDTPIFAKNGQLVNLDDLMTVDGVGEQRARAVREGLSRLAESSILERYV